MVKNYLIGAVRPVIKTWYPGEGGVAQLADNEDWQRAYKSYRGMYKLSRTSARRYLAGEWKEITYTAPVLDARLFQIGQWYMIKELWHERPCNILIMTADTLFIRPTEIFGVFPEMRLFNYTDPQYHADLVGYNGGHYFNDAVMYLPATMDPKIWELGERHMEDWFTHRQSRWDCGQLINNHMFWSQDIAEDQRLRPDLNWQMLRRDTMPSSIQAGESWNRCAMDQASILHFAGSRGHRDTLNVMREFASRFAVTTDGEE